MKKIFVFTAVLFLTALAVLIWQFSRPAGHYAEIVQNGTVIGKIDLDQEKGSRRMVIKAPDGGFNVLLMENGRIRIEDADCPRRDCVKMGWLRAFSMPLVCLPHHLMVRFSGEASDSLDSISQ